MFQWIIRFYENASVIKFQIKEKLGKQRIYAVSEHMIW